MTTVTRRLSECYACKLLLCKRYIVFPATNSVNDTCNRETRLIVSYLKISCNAARSIQFWYTDYYRIDTKLSNVTTLILLNIYYKNYKRLTYLNLEIQYIGSTCIRGFLATIFSKGPAILFCKDTKLRSSYFEYVKRTPNAHYTISTIYEIQQPGIFFH